MTSGKNMLLSNKTPSALIFSAYVNAGDPWKFKELRQVSIHDSTCSTDPTN